MEHRHSRGNRISAIVLCALLSLLLHLILALLLIHSSTRTEKMRITSAASAAGQRFVRVQRPKHRSPEPQQEEQKKQRAFAKTSADASQMLPERADFEGSRNTRAASAPDAEQLLSEKEAPAQLGEKKDELVTFDQERQDGDLKHEGQKPPTPPVPPQPQVVDVTTPPPAQQAAPPITGQAEAENDAPHPEATDRENSPAPTTRAAEPPPPTAEGKLLLRKEDTSAEVILTEPPASAAATRNAIEQELPPTLPKKPGKKHPVFFDPSLATPQPDSIGFRTTERRSRSSGRFVVGRGASLNVTATPLGRYESEIYRRIAYFWYRACDDHRGDIIPGSISISLRINKQGHLENMQLVRRHGAGVIQQSFTFRAIRQATLPPMPATVRQELVGELLELIFTFNFD